MFEKAKQVIVVERLENGPYLFGGILIGDKIIAMDNGAILNAKSEHIELIKELPWISLSNELIGF